MDKSVVKNIVLDVVRATLVALVVNVVGVLLIAIVVKYTAIGEAAATAVNQVLKVVSLTVGALVGIRGGRLGWLTGAIAGLLYTVVSLGVFSLLAGESLFALGNLYDCLLGLVSGEASGILAVNVRGHKAPKRAPRG